MSCRADPSHVEYVFTFPWVKIRKLFYIILSINKKVATMKHYIRLSVECANEEMADIVMAFLADYPFETFDTTPHEEGLRLDAYILVEAWCECRTEALEAIADYGEVSAEEQMEDENWNETWERESFAPIAIAT